MSSNAVVIAEGFLLVVTGPPGAGKSAASKVLVQRYEPSALVEGDQFFAFLARGAIEPWLPESNEQNRVVLESAASCAGRFSAGGMITIYDGVVGPWFLETFGRATGLTEFDYVVLMPRVEVCVERVMTRAGHGFRDEAAARKMYEEFHGAQVSSRHRLAIGSEPVEDVADRIADARSTGALKVVVGGPPPA